MIKNFHRHLGMSVYFLLRNDQHVIISFIFYQNNWSLFLNIFSQIEMEFNSLKIIILLNTWLESQLKPHSCWCHNRNGQPWIHCTRHKERTRSRKKVLQIYNEKKQWINSIGNGFVVAIWNLPVPSTAKIVNGTKA